MQKERIVMHLLLKNAVIVLVVAAVAAPLASAETAAGKVIRSGTFYDGYKSSYPQLHATLSAHVSPVPSRGFDWGDASVGAGTASGVIVLLAGSALLFVRRRTRLAV
jgi:LPXTG-motif cell wall-anchored protein